MDMANEFQGTEFATRDMMLDAIAYEFMTAGGLNDSETVTELLENDTDENLAIEAIENWDLGDVTADELAGAISDFRKMRPDAE
jgi:hypothetical protein